MRRLRPLAFVLTLLVSPLGVAVCEVVCGLPAHAAGHTPVPAQTAAIDAHAAAHAHHDHHAHHAPPPAAPVPPASKTDGVVTLPGPACDPVSGTPARVRASFSGPDLHAVVISQEAVVFVAPASGHPRLLVADSGPPHPPRHAPIPLRI